MNNTKFFDKICKMNKVSVIRDNTRIHILVKGVVPIGEPLFRNNTCTTWAVYGNMRYVARTAPEDCYDLAFDDEYTKACVRVLPIRTNIASESDMGNIVEIIHLLKNAPEGVLGTFHKWAYDFHPDRYPTTTDVLDWLNKVQI